MTVTLVLGGQRSGKSAYAEALLEASSEKTYIATAEPGDEEMDHRIALHLVRRGENWHTVEEPLVIAPALEKPDVPVLVDCLSLWLANLLEADLDVAAETDVLAAALKNAKADVVLVSSEVGLGIIPDNKLARAYADALGTLNQRIAAVADRVVLVTAGLPHILKDEENA